MLSWRLQNRAKHSIERLQKVPAKRKQFYNVVIGKCSLCRGVVLFDLAIYEGCDVASSSARLGGGLRNTQFG